MSKTELLSRLRDLHEELSAINMNRASEDQVDEATVDALGQLVTDASELIDKVKSDDDSESMMEPLKTEHGYLMDRILEFDQAHPGVRNFLTQMTDMLAMMGI